MTDRFLTTDSTFAPLVGCARRRKNFHAVIPSHTERDQPMTRTTLDSLTIGDLRALIHYGGAETTTLADALAELDAADAAGREGDRQAGELAAEVRAWLEGRSTAARDAAAHVHAQAGRNEGLSSGAALAAGRAAGTEAAEHYERTVPRPQAASGRFAVPLEYTDEAESIRPSGIVDRVKGFVS